MLAAYVCRPVWWAHQHGASVVTTAHFIPAPKSWYHTQNTGRPGQEARGGGEDLGSKTWKSTYMQILRKGC